MRPNLIVHVYDSKILLTAQIIIHFELETKGTLLSKHRVKQTQSYEPSFQLAKLKSGIVVSADNLSTSSVIDNPLLLTVLTVKRTMKQPLRNVGFQSKLVY